MLDKIKQSFGFPLSLSAIKKRLLIGICISAVSVFASASEESCKQYSDISLHVITSGGFAAAYTLLKPQFESETGIELDTSYGSSSGGAFDSIPERLSRGEEFDVIMLSNKSLHNLMKAGYALPTDARDLVVSKIGMAVKEGAEHPDISTVEKFVEVLREAPSIGYSASASGTYLSTVLWPKMGIWDEIKDKSLRVKSERVATLVARDEVEIGFQQISEILPIEGAEFVAPIPDELQKKTVFSAAITSASEQQGAARCFLDFITSPEADSTIRSTGLIPLYRDFQ